eukprot:6213972-Pleurochrysis_carterae.AAC.2
MSKSNRDIFTKAKSQLDIALDFAGLSSTQHVAYRFEGEWHVAGGRLQFQLHIQQRAQAFTHASHNGGLLLGDEGIAEP